MPGSAGRSQKRHLCSRLRFLEALTGIPPFQGNSATTMRKHQSEAPPTLKEVTLGKEFPEEIEKLIARL